jgi:glycosyltransferase involved in cell wall biosynthesis
MGEDKTSAFLESNVFVMPSFSENFSMATVEAMSFGLPVVVTRGVGIGFLIENYGAGLVVEKKVSDLSRAILRILQKPALSLELAKHGKLLVEAEFSPKKVAKRMLDAYEEIVHNYK